jgi:hypothetical protein
VADTHGRFRPNIRDVVRGMQLLGSAQTIGELAASLAQDLKDKGIAQDYADDIAQALVGEFAMFEVPQPRPGALTAPGSTPTPSTC